MATAYITRFSGKVMSLAQKPIVQRAYRFSLLQTIEIAEVVKQKSFQLYDMFPFKHSVNELKQVVQYIANFDQKYILSCTLKDCVLFCIVFTELLFWFFVGEIIGKRNIFGYLPLGHH